MEWLTQNWLHITSNAIAALALFVAFHSFRESKRLRELAEKIESDRQRDLLRACLRCEFEEFSIGAGGAKFHNQFYLWLLNDGPAVAFGIEIELDGRPIRELSGLVVDWAVPGELASGAKFKCCRLVPGADRSSHSGKLRWKDGSDESQETPISFKP